MVTGGAARIGKALCVNLAEKGYDIALHYNSSEERALETKAEILRAGARCELFRADLSSPPNAVKLAADAADAFAGLRVLVNNASVFRDAGFRDVTPEFLETDFAVNFKAPFFLSQSFSERVPRGLIVNFLDTRVGKNSTSHFAYNLAKKCLYHLTKMLARELAPDIRVNAVCPGVILPPAGQGSDYLERMSRGLPMARHGTLSDVTEAFNYLLENGYVTGECLMVDGGGSLC